MDPNSISNLVITILCIMLALAIAYFFWDDWQSKKWTQVCEGKLERILHGGLAKGTPTPLVIHAIIMEDGRSFHVGNLPLPNPGTTIRIMKNGKAEFRIEIVAKK